MQTDHEAIWSIKMSVYNQDWQKEGVVCVIGMETDTEMSASESSIVDGFVDGNEEGGKTEHEKTA